MGGFFLEEGSYRPTLAGAILMAWYNMWPLSWVRRGFYSIRSKYVLRRLNLSATEQIEAK
jgi:hypothetical protein